MKFTLFFLLSCLVVALVVARPEEEKYTNRFDNIDVDGILKSDRLLMNYHKCLMDKGPCSPDAAELKKVLNEALETECAKCTETQRTMAQKVIKHLIEHRRKMWDELVEKYDPENKFRSKYEKQAKEAGIEI